MIRSLRSSYRILVTMTVALIALLLLAGPASAHPSIEGGEAPVNSLASLTLDLGHGCPADGADGGHDDGHGDEGGHSHGGEELPTTEVALQVPEGMWIFDVDGVDAYEVSFERDDDGTIEVVVWEATNGAVPAPRFPIDVVIEADEGDELYLGVFQACDDFIYRWVGTPDEPADDPAIALQLVAADPDAPAPDRADSPLYQGDDPTDDPTEDPADADAADDPSHAGDATDDDTAADEEATDDAAEEEAVEATPISTPSDPESSPLLWSIVALVAGVVVIGVVLALRRRPVADGAPDEGDTSDRTP